MHATLFVDGARWDIGPDARSVDLPPGARTLVVDGDPLMVMPLPSPARTTEIDVDAAKRSVRVLAR